MANASLTIDAVRLLQALTGVAYIVDRSGIVIAVGGIDWLHLVDAGDAAGLAPERFVGRSLFDAMTSDAVRNVARRVHDRVLQRGVQRFDYPYRCDAPDSARYCQMTMTPIPGASGVAGVLYHSRIVEEQGRPAMGLFDPMAQLRDEARQLVVICSYCQKVAWPVGAAEADRSWISADEYYRRGGSDDVRVSHGVCPACLDMMTGPADPAASPSLN